MEKDNDKEETYVGWDGEIDPKIAPKTHFLLSNKVLKVIENQHLDVRVDILSYCLFNILITEQFTMHQAGIVLDDIKAKFDYLLSGVYQKGNKKLYQKGNQNGK